MVRKAMAGGILAASLAAGCAPLTLPMPMPLSLPLPWQPPASSPETGAAALHPAQEPLWIHGRVYFAVRSAQAPISEVAAAATVSLIDPVANETKATTVTNGQGQFTLPIQGIPAATTYFLEAVKGLGNNAVGKDAVRVRTLIRYQGSTWASLTGLTGGIVISPSTTALSAIASHKGAASVDPGGLIGSIRVGVPSGDLPDTFDDVGTGVTKGEFAQVRDLVATSLVVDWDPFDAIVYTGASFQLKPGVADSLQGPAISYVSPQLAAPGDIVTINGTNFSPTPGSNQISFEPGVATTPGTASATVLKVVVPAGARSGDIAVTVSGKTATVPIAIIPPVDGGLKP